MKTKKFLRSALSLMLTLLMLISASVIGFSPSAAQVDIAETGATITSDGTARLYFNMSAVSWWTAGTNGNGNFAYFFNSSGNAWSAHAVNYSGNTYYVVIPAGSWTTVILTRNNTSTSPSWDNKWNQTGNITLSSTSNYISKFSENSTSATWGTAVKPASTATLSASATTVAPGEAVTLTPALSSNATLNTIKSTTYSVGTGASVSGNTFTATQPGTYTVTATVTYHPNGYSSLTSTATASKTITVKASNVTATFKDWDGTQIGSVQTIPSGSAPTAPANPTREGYTFTGWNPAVGAISSDTEYIAQYSENKSNIEFKAGTGGTVTNTGSTSVGYTSSKSSTATASSGYTFTGWTVSGGTAGTDFRYTSGDASASSITVKPLTNGKTLVFTANFTSVPTNTVKAVVGLSGAGTATPVQQEVVEGGTVELKATANAGYVFTGWSITGTYTAVTGDVNSATFKITPASDITATANFRKYSATVTFKSANNANGTVTNAGGSVEYPGSLTSTANPTAGYNFKAWTISGTEGTDYEITSGDVNSATIAIKPLKDGITITATATFQIRTFTVTFLDMDGNTLDTQTVNYGSGASAPTAPTVVGYTFKEWDKTFNNITADTTVQAVYTANTYTVGVTYSSGGTAESSAASVTYPDTVTLTATPAANYAFAGWTINGAYDVVEGSTGSKTFVIRPKANVTAQANFVEGQYLTVHSYSSNGYNNLYLWERNAASTSNYPNGEWPGTVQPNTSDFNGVNWKTSNQFEMSLGYSNEVGAILNDGGLTIPSGTGNLIMFNNTLGWSNVYLYTSSSDGSLWSSNGNGATTSGRTAVTMTKISGTNYYYAYVSGTIGDTLFVKDKQDNYGNIWETSASYRSDYSSSNPMFTPSTTSNETRNNTKYYNSGSWGAKPTGTLQSDDILITDYLYEGGTWKGVSEVWIYQNGTTEVVTLRRDLLDLITAMTAEYNGGTNVKDYTAESWTAFVNAYNDAYTKSGAAATTQAQLDAAEAALREAYENLELQAYFNLTVTQTGGLGTVKIDNTSVASATEIVQVVQNKSVSIMITPPTGYYIKSISGVITGENGSMYTGNATITANGELNIVYAENPTVSAEQNQNGTITINGSETPVDVTYGEDAELVISAPDLYYVQSVTINGSSVYNDSDETQRSFTYTLENVTADTKIVVTYGKCSTYEVTIEQYPEEGGKLYYDGELIPYEGMVIEVVAGDNVTITAEPNSGYGINYWVADSQTSGRELTYTFSAISADHTLDIEWQELQNVTVTVVTRPAGVANSTANGSVTTTVLQYEQVTLTTQNTDPCYKFVNWTIEGSFYDADSTTKSDTTYNIRVSGGNIKATANYDKVARKIYLQNDANWSQPKLYTWGSSTTTTAWPGDLMTYDSASGYWVGYIPLDATNIQFNDGTSSNQVEFSDVAKNLYNNSTHTSDTYVEPGYYLQGQWNGKVYSGYDLQKFVANGDGTYSYTITVTSTTDGYIYVNPTNENSHFWNAATLNATGNPQTLVPTGAYQTSPKYVKVEIDTTSYTKLYDVTFTFNPTTGEFSWTKAENVPTITVIGTDGIGKNESDTNMDSSNGRVGDTYFDDTTINRQSYHTYYNEAQVVAGEAVTFFTQVNNNTSGIFDYYVAGWVINGTDFVSATSLGKGLYSGSYVFTEDDTTVVPVYFHTNEWLAANNVSTVTVYAVADMGITNWNQYFASYTWYKDAGTKKYEQFGAYPGQLMIPIAGLDNVYYTLIETSAYDGTPISGVTFSNYAPGDGMDTVVTDYSNIQTYDYYEFIALLEDGKENITFVIKDTNDTYNSNRVSTSSINITNGNWDFVQYTDYSGLKTDIFGNDIEDIDSTLSDNNALYVIQAGDKNYSGVGNLDGQWYVDCYLYTATGAYIGKCYSYELHDEDSAIWTTLEAYEGQRAYISYEHVNGARYDGEWYGDSDLSVTINLGVNVALMGIDGNYVIDTEGNVNEADYGTGYIDAVYQNVDVTRGTVVTLSAMPKVGFKFVGWYSADGTLFSNNTTVTVTAAIGTTYTAVFEPLAEGSFYVNHYIYQGLGNTNYYIPDVHGGNAVLYVGIQNITQGTGTTLIRGNSASLEATEGDELYITIATDATGADKFYAWYTDAIDGEGNPTFEEVGVDSDDNLYNNNGTVVGRSDIVYFQFKHTVGDLFSMNLYSDLMPQSIDVTLVYKYNDRYDNIKTYSVPYILTDEEVDGFAGNNFTPYTPAYISSTDGSWVNTVIVNAPYVEDYYKDTTWIISSAMYDTMTFNLWATQPYTMYTVTSQIGSDVIINQVPYNTVLDLDAMKLSANATREGFWYNDVDHNGKYDETIDIVLTYRSHYGYRVTQDMSINYENKYDYDYDFDVSLDAPVYGREQTTDSKGNITSDKVYVDYIINILTPDFYGRWNSYKPYYNGQLVNEDWQGNHCTIETLLREGAYKSISYGVILEQVTSLDIKNDYNGVYADAAAAAAANNGFGTATDEETLKAFVEAGKNGWIGGGNTYGTIMDATSHNITNKNRIQFVINFNNTEKNQNRFYNVYSYVTVTTNDGVTTTYISNVQTLNIYETGVSDATVNDNTSFE